jgi:serine/threonine protein kinase
MNVGDIDEIIPEFDANYNLDFGDQNTGTKDSASKDSTGARSGIHISRTYPLLRELADTGGNGDACLIEYNGLETILKFYESNFIPHEDAVKRLKKLSEELKDSVVHIHEYGYDENTERWYVVEEYATFGSLKEFYESDADLKIMNLVIKEIIEKLNVLHENHLLHLNLKPSNILIREKQPLHLVFTDFNMSLMIESEHMKGISHVKGSPIYSSPELLRGVVGQEADYWSLGMIILELLSGGDPLKGIGDKPISDILSSKSISIPENAAENYKILLRGLLTKDPRRRWGYTQVKRWLEEDTNIPAYFSDFPEEDKKKISEVHAVPYTFLDKEYLSIEDMIPAFLKSEEAWEVARDHLYQGNISKWLMKNSDEDKGSRVDNIREQSSGDPDLALISLIYTLKDDLPFIFYGKLITLKNLYIYAGKSLRNDTSKGEESVINCLLNGKLIDYYREFMMLASKIDDELISLLETMRRAFSGKDNDQERLNTLYKMLDILANPDLYVLPDKIAGNFNALSDFIAVNIDHVMAREKYDELIGNLIIPEELNGEIRAALSSGLPSDYSKGLDRIKEGSLLKREEFDRLQDEYILPTWLEDDLLGKGASGYVDAIKLLNDLRKEGLFIKKNDFLNYSRKYSQFVGHVVDQKSAVPHGLKGESVEQRWMRFFRCDAGYEGYVKLARYIKNNVTLSLIPRIEEIIERVSLQTVVSDSLNEIIKYLDVLKSAEVKWDNIDNQIVNEIHSLIFAREKSPFEFFERMIEGVPRKFLHTFMKKVPGIDADEQTREMELTLGGALVGVCIGLIAWVIIASLELETSFYGPAVLGLLFGLLRKSIPTALICAATGFSVIFLPGLETVIEVIYAFLIAITGSAEIGAFLGRRIGKFSLYDDALQKYSGRINDVVNSAEGTSN